ncbi:hypothetical protein ACIBEH_08850 [Nocardia salmonicida]|uniref:hypothetical protein n=1 Tax=Nocardia salmonicida TaxID=53431 RepID=UPI0033D6CE5A
MTVFHVGTLGVFKIMDNHDQSSNADDDRSKLDNDGKQAWEDDRSIIGDEWSRLRAGSDVTMEGERVKPEPFGTWTHQEIWDALHGKDGKPAVDAGQINATADGWRRLTTGTETAVNNYRTSFERVLSEKWSGASGTAAIDGVKSYTTEAAKLHITFQMVANGIDYMEGILGQAKIAIPKPEEVSSFDELIGHIPGNGVVKAAKHRANEAEEDARLFMIGTYQPGSITVDRQTPILPVPINNIGDPGGVPDTGGNGNDGGSNNDSSNGNNSNGGGSSTDPAGIQEDPATTEPQATDPDEDQNDDGTGDDSTEPSSTDPSATTPAATTPAGTGTPTTPGGGAPGSGSPGSGSPGSGSPGSGVPSGGAQGAAVPGTPGGAAAAAGSGNRAGTTSGVGGRGMSGMPGMMGGGRGGGKGEDDSEHAIPDYLIQDREDELIGLLPPTLPPGGVIGA